MLFVFILILIDASPTNIRNFLTLPLVCISVDLLYLEYIYSKLCFKYSFDKAMEVEEMQHVLACLYFIMNRFYYLRGVLQWIPRKSL